VLTIGGPLNLQNNGIQEKKTEKKGVVRQKKTIPGEIGSS